MAIQISPPPLHEWQRDLFYSGARFRVAACGRRSGKTHVACVAALDVAVPGGRVWWVAPTTDTTMRGWNVLTHLAVQIPGAELRKSAPREIRFPSGGFITFKTTNSDASLVGEGLDFIVMDEAALVSEDAWTRDLRPSLSDRKGGALFISTPRGRNWFFHAYVRGMKDSGDWKSWRVPTSDNPIIDDEELASARELLPERTFRQEYLAEFLEDGGAVFRNITACATVPVGATPDPRGDYVFGVDWGKSNDFTAIAIVDRNSRQLVHIDHFNQVSWSLQRGRLVALYEQWNPRAIWAEENSMGGPNVEALQAEGLPVYPFTTTAQSKGPLIESLALAFEKSEIAIINDFVLVGELQAYTLERLPSGRFRYNAPAGMHDDCVIAAALAWHGVMGAQLFTPALNMASEETYGIGRY